MALAGSGPSNSRGRVAASPSRHRQRVRRVPAALGQAVLLKLAKDKTEQLYLASIPSALPDAYKGIGVIKAS